MTENQSIKDTLNVIRKALEDENDIDPTLDAGVKTTEEDKEEY